MRNTVMWIRDDFLRSKVAYEKMIVHEYSVVEQPEEKSNRIAVDTNLGRLTCLVLEGEQRRFLQTGV
ncbi:MAG: hypothetical protein PSN04_04090 [Methyloprofundus sp.]|nr:hypothetical protein [Methyloprofundus sp.]